MIFVGKRIVAMMMCLIDQTNNCLIHFYKRCVSPKSYNCSGLEKVHKIKKLTNCHPTYVSWDRVRGDRDLCNINFKINHSWDHWKKQKVPSLVIRIRLYCRTCNNLSKMTKLQLLDSFLQEVCINFDLTMSVNIFLVIFAWWGPLS